MPRGARSDWGSVTEVERGRRYRLRYWAETPEGYRRVSETVRGTRRHATDVLAQRRVELSADSWQEGYEDVVVGPRDPPVEVLGTVVWWQAYEDVTR